MLPSDTAAVLGLSPSFVQQHGRFPFVDGGVGMALLYRRNLTACQYLGQSSLLTNNSLAKEFVHYVVERLLGRCTFPQLERTLNDSLLCRSEPVLRH